MISRELGQEPPETEVRPAAVIPAPAEKAQAKEAPEKVQAKAKVAIPVAVLEAKAVI